MNKLLFLLLFFCGISYGGVIPMPIIMNSDGGLSDNSLLAMVIAVNLIFLMSYLIRTLIWKYKTKILNLELDFFEYVVYSSYGINYSDIVGIMFLIINGIFLTLYLMIWINDLLGG